ncbi:MAG: FHA domain-containing protein [Tissierellia bacterium]|nr:FHA domain-containing protein [Tissierellia bacterium]
MFNILSSVFKYIFIVVVYSFIFRILKLIYLDISTMDLGVEREEAYLKLLNKRVSIPYKVKEYYSLGDGLSFGRMGDNDVILDDQFISKHHAKIVKDEGFYFLEDLDSSNGTFLNGNKIGDVAKLKDGDRIGMGALQFIYLEGDND